MKMTCRKERRRLICNWLLVTCHLLASCERLSVRRGQILVAMHFVWGQAGLVDGLPLTQHSRVYLG
jgi:hypothetical protein